MLLMEEFDEVLDLSQAGTSVSQCSTHTGTDTSSEQLSPELFPSDQEDLPSSSSSKRTESSQSSTSTSLPQNNNNLLNPGCLTAATQKMLTKLPRTRRINPNTTLCDETSNVQMFSLCAISGLDLVKKPRRPTSALASFKLDNTAPGQGNLDMGLSRARLKSVIHPRQTQLTSEQDFSVSANVTEQKQPVTGLDQVELGPGLAGLQVSVAVNTEVETTVPEPPQFDWLPSASSSPSVSPGLGEFGCCSVRVASTESQGQDILLDVQPVSAVEPPAPETSNNTDEPLDTIVNNVRSSLLVNNIDIYRHIDRGPWGKYQLHGAAFQYVIFTGVITNKSTTRKSITQLEVDDGTAVVKCLFDDLQCLSEHRTSFHKYLDSWKHTLAVCTAEPVLDDTFHFLREYAKRLFQESPQSGDLMLGDEVTVVGKVYDSKKEGRVIYHKYAWRKMTQANRRNSGFGPGQYAKQGRHF